jgi:multiple sugar transport system permease protein
VELRAWSVIFANIWRGVPFVAITLLAGLQTVSPSLYEAGDAGWRHVVAALPLHHLSAADADHRGRHDLLGAVHLHRLPADLGADARRSGECHASDGDAELSARHSFGRRLGEGAAIATAMIPFLLAAIAISWFGMQRRKWQQGTDND